MSQFSTVSARCVACGGTLKYLGEIPLRIGGTSGGWALLMGKWAERGEALWDVAVFGCADCGRYDFYAPNSPLAEQAK